MQGGNRKPVISLGKNIGIAIIIKLANDEKENGYGLGIFWYENPQLALAAPLTP